MEQYGYETITQTVQDNQQKMENRQSAFDVIFIVSVIFVVLVFAFTIAMIVSPKLRGKMMSKQVKAVKHMTDYSKDDIESIGATLGGVQARTRKRILDENEDILADATEREADIKKGYVKKMARAVKEGLADEYECYCKHCGAVIDSDSTFCKVCGKKQ